MKSRSAGSLLLLVGLLIAPVQAVGLPPSPTTCYAFWTAATVCSLGSCTTTYYLDDYWCSRSPSSDTVPNPAYNNPSDLDQNLRIDDFKDVLKTSDPCAYQFDNGDRLGTNHGGPNTNRPGHNGVDLQANLNDPVSVVAHGRVSVIGWENPSNHQAGCGYRMIVEHLSGDTSVYCHLVDNSAQFQVGDWVRAGTVIGLANSTGNSSGHHLHLIYWQNGSRIEYWNVAGSQPSAAQLNGGC